MWRAWVGQGRSAGKTAASAAVVAPGGVRRAAAAACRRRDAAHFSPPTMASATMDDLLTWRGFTGVHAVLLGGFLLAWALRNSRLWKVRLRSSPGNVARAATAPLGGLCGGDAGGCSRGWPPSMLEAVRRGRGGRRAGRARLSDSSPSLTLPPLLPLPSPAGREHAGPL